MIEQSPNPEFSTDSITGTAVLLVSYFARRSLRGFSAEEDRAFAEALDSTVSALAGLYAYDMLAHGTISAVIFGQHPADEYLEGALSFARAAQVKAESVALGMPHTSGETETMLKKLRDNKKTQGQEATRAAPLLRNEAADILVNATRSADKYPYAYEDLSHAGNAAALALNALSPAAKTHDQDSASQNLKENIAAHLSNAIKAAEAWQP